MIKNNNPFNITKAVDYSDIEIDKFWVDIPGGNGFIDIMKPDSTMPLMILGGKGSGKTHIMRYFSYNLQKIRYEKDLTEAILKEKYIGVFLRCGGLNSSKFSGSNQSSDAWKNIFSYYFELWLSQLVVNIIEEIISASPERYEKANNKICEQVHRLFDVDTSEKFHSISSLKTYLQDLQRMIDFEVNNCAITGKKISDVTILVSPGRLVFGLPKILKEHLPFLDQAQFIYLIDEYENLLEYQQKYINTLIREREDPVSFRIGARWYGIKTYQTFSGDEALKVGSEYEKVVIDQLLRNRRDAYAEFARNIFLKRLEKAGCISSQMTASNIKIGNYFQDFDQNTFFEKLQKKEESVSRSYLKALRNNLRSKLPEKQIDIIISNLIFKENPLIERANIFLFYREWNNGATDLVLSSAKIQDDCRRYVLAPSDKSTMQYKILDKFKHDILDQLHREAREKLPYYGIERIIKMSAGIPRLFLIMLKHIYRWSIYNGEVPFQELPISEDAQQKGIEDAMKWFLDDARVPGPTGNPISNTIDRVGQLLHEIRFSDVPPECSLSSFSINSSDITDNIKSMLDYLEQYSYLIKSPDRREKNSSVQRTTYQINGLLAPNWELPIFTRGVLQLTSKEILAIFAAQADDDFQKIKTERRQRYNAPFREGTVIPLNLFDAPHE